jgi:type IX secretion system PorP/SprF family membrane protein
MKKFNKKVSITFCFIFFVNLTAKAQLNLFGSSYFHNQYLNNASYAGLTNGLQLAGGLSNLWTIIPGSPEKQFFTANYGFENRRYGLGIILKNEKAGLIRKSNMDVSWSYHVPLGREDEQLNFGMSLGIQDQHIDLSEIDSDQGDVQITRFNDEENQFDADLGLSYTSKKLNLQASMPRLRNLFNQGVDNGINKIDFLAVVSYKLESSANSGIFNGMSAEPKLVLRSIRGNSDIIDAGAQISFSGDILSFLYIYHSTRSNSFGFKMKYDERYQLLGIYSTNSSETKNFVNSNFEVGLKVIIF